MIFYIENIIDNLKALKRNDIRTSRPVSNGGFCPGEYLPAATFMSVAFIPTNL